MTSIFAPLAAADVNHHALTVDVADFQVGQLSASGAGGIESHEQDALRRSACRMHELSDFFATKNRRQVVRLLRIRSVGNAPGSVQSLDVEKTQGRQVLSHGTRRQLAFLKKFSLIFANLSRA
jgi:hypothetical protein